MRALCVLMLLVGSLSSVVATADEPLSERFGLVHGEPDFCADLGVGWTRHDISWDGIEREKGTFNFGEWPARVDGFLAKGVNLLPILDYNPAWDRERSPADDQTRADFANYAVRCIERFGDRLKYWQVWNEPNITFWKPEPNAYDYAELLRVTYEAAKKADPTVQILGFNCSDIDLDFTERVARYGGLRYCDILAYQPYRVAPEVGHFEEMEALRRLVADFNNGVQKPIWFTEMGWATQHFPFQEAPGLDLMAERPARRQSAFLVRYMVIIEATGVDKVFWFSQAADGAGLEDHPQNKKRLSFYAYQHLIKLLDHYTTVREVVPRGAFGRYAYLFDCPEHDVVVAWSVNGPQDLALPGLSEAREMRDMLGKPMPKPSGDMLRITGEPVYLIYEHAPEVLQARTKAQVKARYWLQPGESAPLAMDQVDPSDEPLRLRIESPDGLACRSRASIKPCEASQGPDLKVARRVKPGRRTVRVSQGETSWDVEVNVVPRVLWTYQGDSKGFLTPAPAGAAYAAWGVLLTAYDTPDVVCLSHKGKELWRYREAAPINSALVPALFDIEPPKAVCFAQVSVGAVPSRQMLFALDSEGVMQWRMKLEGEPPKDTPGWDWTHPVAAALYGDIGEEILYADALGFVTCVSGEGTILWRRQVSDARCDRPVCVANICDSEKSEILVADAKGRLHCLSNKGEVLWTVETGADIAAAPVADCMEPGSRPAIFVANRAERLIRFDDNGKEVWSAPLGGTMDLGAGIVLADLDGDEIEEVVASTRNHEVLCFDAKGNNLWRVETGAQIRSVPAVGDVDGDGAPEVLVGSADWLLYCIDGQGRIEWTFNTGNRIDASPLLADLDDDEWPDIVIPTRGGKVFALSAR